MTDEYAEAFKKEADDPSMQAYLRSLGLDPDYVPPSDDPRRVVVKSLSIVFKEHGPSAVIDFNTDYDGTEKTVIKHKEPLIIKEGTEFKMLVEFRVQHQIVHGFKIHSTVKKMGASIVDETVMLGSYPPSNNFKTVTIQDYQPAPSGTLGRGEYMSHMKFLDDTKKLYLDIEYKIKISKDWK
ncbi:uncharacterized protein LOC135145879 [Zophobas morio]|uniref:uncharacterized protein LOC135145879 n=1 Tax=Zophobas morio TaxID=2755281 RepID=UPI003082C7E4